MLAAAAAGVSHPAVAALLGLGAAGLAGVVVAGLVAFGLAPRSLDPRLAGLPGELAALLVALAVCAFLYGGGRRGVRGS